MLVTKRDGRLEPVQFEKITRRIQKLCYGTALGHSVIAEIAQKVIIGLYDRVTTAELDRLAAETAAAMATNHPDYSLLAARIEISNLYKQTSDSFYNTMHRLYTYVDPKTGENAPLLDSKVYRIIKENAAALDAAMRYENDFEYDYFGFKTLERSYLMRLNGKVVERPQHMLMRVAVGIHQEDIERSLETYRLMSEKFFTHATPTLFNAGTPKPQLSSCFLLTMQEDSIDGIYDTLKQCAKISQYAGGIGLSIHTIRSTGSYIRGTNGVSNGIVPMLRNFDATARYVDQGGGKRKGSFAIYLEPWHSDIFAYLDLKKNHGKEEMRARDLFYALWIPDLFMQRVKENGSWSLFSPSEAPGLCDLYGEAFDQLYLRYEREGRARKQVKAQELWFEILKAQIETGTPYMLYKDACNKKSNQKNIGTIRSSNLCTEIVQYSSKDEIAVCNLASISLPKFVNAVEKSFDHQKLFEITKTITRNLNKVIDINFYVVPACKRSNLRHRPMAIGVQGLADVFLLMRLPFDGAKARELNEDIFETIYYAALVASSELAMKKRPYDSFVGSPASKGILQFDMWGITPRSGRWDWAGLRKRIIQHGLRNSLLVGPMPTASTSQIMGNNECFEPYTSNIYVRRVLSGEFIVINKHLLRDLTHRGLWSSDIKNQLIAHNGSVQAIDEIPNDLKQLYRTVWEIPQKHIIEMSADRAAYVDQSQSLNLHLANPTLAKLTSMHFYAWEKGLKTGMYYLRTKAAADAIQFTVDKSTLASQKKKTLQEKGQTSLAPLLLGTSDDSCEMCSG